MTEQTLNFKSLSKSDFESDQEVRWCPGCGDYAILASMQKYLAGSGLAREDVVFVSGIGCSSRFPYYMNTYGFHTIHGRAPTIATGLKLANPNLHVFVITGDGDGLSIGTNHLLHLMRKNVDVTVLLINNQIYGLTKGQYSPTSEQGKKTKSSPFGSVEQPLSPIALAFAANCGFIARGIDVDATGLQTILQRAHQFKGTRFIEIFQNCNVFNDGAFSHFSDRQARSDKTIFLEPQKPMNFGKNQERGLKREATGQSANNLESLVEIQGLGDCYQGYMDYLKFDDTHPVPLGILREEERPILEKHPKVIDKSSLESILLKDVIIKS